MNRAPLPVSESTRAYPPPPWRLSGQAWLGLFPADATVPLPPDLQPLLSPRWLILLLVRYQSGTLRYDEFAVGALVRLGRWPGVWVDRMWVTDEVACRGGREIWGLPKDLARITWAGPSVLVTDRDGEIATLRLENRPLRLPPVPVPVLWFGEFAGHRGFTVARFQGWPVWGSFRIETWTDRLPYRPASQPLLSIAARLFRLTVPGARMPASPC